MYPRKFEDLIIAFQKLPGVGAKTAERYAFHALEWDPETIQEMIQSLEGLKNIHHCKVCGNLSDEDTCEFCKSEYRDHRIICVVQSPKDIGVIEGMQEFNGVYHVLNGVINTQKGILPDQLNIDSLVKRIDDDTKEVILALDPTVEGETTALYLSKLLENKVTVTRLAHGIPVGGHLDYTDARTLQKAFQGRK